MRVYIAGPVTGHQDHNRPAFEAAAAMLADSGHEPVIPHHHVPPEAPWDEAMRICLPLVSSCDGIALLPGWRQSMGACLEAGLAQAEGMPVVGGWEALAGNPEGIRGKI